MHKTLISEDYNNWRLLMIFVTCTAHQISLGNEIKEEDVCRACGTHTGKEKLIQSFGGTV
jgi:UDP-N-acetylglucosamine transferase subunit ALG13